MIDKKIIELFCATEEPELLKGGQGVAVKVGEAVFKPIYNNCAYHNDISKHWNALNPTKYRITRHIKSVNNTYCEHGYGASEYIKLLEKELSMKEILEVSKNLHEDLKKLNVKKLLKSEDPWTKANQIIWHGEEFCTEKGEEAEKLCHYILNSLNEVEEENQLIHSDLGGNISFDENMCPVVFDFSPAIAPAKFADSVIVADSIAWEINDFSVLDLLFSLGDYTEFIKRAVAFRVITIACNKQRTLDQLFEEWNCYKPVWDKVMGSY